MRTAVAILTCLSLVSCAPLHYTFYKPIGPGDYFGGGSGGPVVRLGLEVTEGLGMMLSTFTKTGAGLDDLRISYFVAEDNVLQFVSPEISLIANEGKIAKYSFEKVSYIECVGERKSRRCGRTETATSTPLKGETEPPSTWGLRRFQNYKMFTVFIDPHKFHADEIQVGFPVVMLNGQQVKSPDIKLRHSSGIYWTFGPDG